MRLRIILEKDMRTTALAGIALAALALLFPGPASAEQFTVYSYNQMYEQQQFNNDSRLADTAFYLVGARQILQEQVDMKPIRYVVWNQIQTANKAAEGISLLDSFSGLMLQNSFYYNTESAPLYYAYPSTLHSNFDEMNGVLLFTVSAYNSSDIVNDPEYAPYAEYYVDMTTVRRHFQEGSCFSPLDWEPVGCDMPYYIASTLESNSLRRSTSMAGQEMLVARAADAAAGYYAKRRENLMQQAAEYDGNASALANDPMDIYTTGHAFADVDGDGAMDFVAGLSVNWPNTPFECMENPALLIISSQAGAVIIEDFGCTGTIPLGLADINGDSILDIVTYTLYWEWSDIEVVSLAGGRPLMLGVEIW